MFKKRLNMAFYYCEHWKLLTEVPTRMKSIQGSFPWIISNQYTFLSVVFGNIRQPRSQAFSLEVNLDGVGKDKFSIIASFSWPKELEAQGMIAPTLFNDML